MPLVQIVSDDPPVVAPDKKALVRRFPVVAGTDVDETSRPVWLNNANSATIGTSLDELDQTFSSVCATLRDFGPASVPLAQIDPQTGSPEHIIAVLRAAWPWRDSIPGYIPFVGQVAKTLRERAIPDVDILLRGMTVESA